MIVEININEHNNNAMHNDDEHINSNDHINDALSYKARAINMHDSYVKAIMAIRTACISPAIKDKESRILDVLRGLDVYADYLPNAYVVVGDDGLFSSLDAVDDINATHLKYLKTVGNSPAVSNVPEDIPTDKDIEVARQCIDRLVNARSTSELTMDEIVNLDKLFYHAYPERLINGK